VCKMGFRQLERSSPWQVHLGMDGWMGRSIKKGGRETTIATCMDGVRSRPNGRNVLFFFGVGGRFGLLVGRTTGGHLNVWMGLEGQRFHLSVSSLVLLLVNGGKACGLGWTGLELDWLGESEKGGRGGGTGVYLHTHADTAARNFVSVFDGVTQGNCQASGSMTGTGRSMMANWYLRPSV
jgi:hypothetical protein